MNISPLRYPGGKSRAIKTIMQYIPTNIKNISSHFIGGGSLELYLNNKGINVVAYDNFNLLINFWQQLKKNKDILHKEVLKYYPLTKDCFKQIQQNIIYETDNIQMAAKFFVLNRCSFSGSTLSGGMSPNHPRFNINSINKLLEIDLTNIDFYCMDFEESINLHKNNFKYLDPPYFINNNLYGIKGNLHKSFNHEKLCKILKNQQGWILSYNDCPEIRQMYDGCKIVELSWKYGMNKTKKSSEILIIN